MAWRASKQFEAREDQGVGNAGGFRMRVWQIGAAIVLAACVAGCGGNSTPVGVIVTPTGTAASPQTVVISGQQPFTATVTGTSTSTVNWFICLPPTNTTVTNPIPVNCGQLTGFGTISSTGLYAAPPTPPPSVFVVAAQSTVNANIYGLSYVLVGTGVRVSIEPSTATVAPGEKFRFSSTVSGSSNSAVTWSVTADSMTVVGGNSTIGIICPSSNDTQNLCANQPAGTYFAPLVSPGAVTITATAAADTSQSATASVTIAAATDPTLSSIAPTAAQEGSVQQDIYLNGQNFLSTSTVLANGVPLPTIFLTTSLLRATIPAAQLATMGSVKILVQRQNGDLSLPVPLTVNPSRPALVASTPDSFVGNSANVGVTLTGGYFSPSTEVFFNAQRVSQSAGGSTRVLQVTIPAADWGPPGLYPITVENTDVVPPNPGISGINIGVEPTSFPSAPSTSITVGMTPSAIAIDPALGLAVVANTGSNNVSIINLATNAQVAGSPVAVGPNPTSVAIDDQLPQHLAVVVNSGPEANGGNSVTAVNLTTLAITTLTLPDTSVPPVTVALPYSIGINPLTHRAIVTQQLTNTAWILDLSSGAPVLVQQIGGSLTPYGTGPTPSVAIDPRLNWALVTPGGSGTINIVDLGRDPGPGDVGRPPVVIGDLTVSTSSQGVGINSQTHQALLTDPNSSASNNDTLTTYSLLDNTVSNVPFLQNGTAIDQPGFVASAINPLSNVGIAVNSLANTAAIVDMENSNVLQTVSGLNTPQAVAIDAATNLAYVVNQESNTVSVVPLGTPGQFRTLQIVESSPAVAFVTNPPTGVTLTINGIGFTGSAQVALDGSPLPAGDVTVVSNRQIIATVPASMLTNARNYIVYVQNGGQWSNTTELTVIQAIPVGNTPIAVAIDQNLDQAVVTNFSDNTVSILNLITGMPILTEPTMPVGSNPEGVSVISRLGLAVVANNGSNNVTILDEAGNNGTFASPTTISCGSCMGPAGVGTNSDTGTAATANTLSNNVSFVTLPTTGTIGTLGATTTVDQFPDALSIAPVLVSPPIPGLVVTNNLATVATASSTNGTSSSSVDVLNADTASIVKGISNFFQLPTGVVFDPVNQDFLVTDSVVNEVVIVDPNTFIVTPFRVGIDPTSLDYNYQTSTLATDNAGSNTISIVSYVCPPLLNAPPNCAGPQVRDVLGIGGLVQPSSVIVGPNAIAIDLKMNLGVLVDQSNNRVLLVPLPH
jgi:DNA-binding beta-propeller fold protein YncE